jgi:hypothetical protein
LVIPTHEWLMFRFRESQSGAVVLNDRCYHDHLTLRVPSGGFSFLPAG